MKFFVFAMCLSAGLISMTPSFAHAQEKKRIVPTSSATTLQLKYFLAPVQTKPGAFTTSLRMVTPILIVPDTSHSPLVCHRMPRVIDALLNYFMKNPAPVDRTRHLDTDALETQKAKMAAYVNRALGLNVVSAVYIFEGGKAMSSGVAARFPGASSNACGAILEENDKKLKEAQKPK